MTDTAARPLADRLRRGLRWFKRFEDGLDFSMDEHLLGRIQALEQIVRTFELRIDRLDAERPSGPQCATLKPTMLSVDGPSTSLRRS